MSKAGIITFVFILLFGFWIASAYIPATKDSFLSKTHFWKNWGKEEVIVYDYSTLYFKAYDNLNNRYINANYVLMFDNPQTTQEGKLTTYAWEEFQAIENETYTLYSWDDDNEGLDYYPTLTECYIPKGESTNCILEPEREGKYSIDFAKISEIEVDNKHNFEYMFRLNIENGSSRDTLICIERGWNVYLARFKDLQKTSKPSQLEYSYNDCYLLDNRTRYEYILEVGSFNLEEEDYIKFLIIDKGSYIIYSTINHAYFGLNNTDVGIENLEKTFYYDKQIKTFK